MKLDNFALGIRVKTIYTPIKVRTTMQLFVVCLEAGPLARLSAMSRKYLKILVIGSFKVRAFLFVLC